MLFEKIKYYEAKEILFPCIQALVSVLHPNHFYHALQFVVNCVFIVSDFQGLFIMFNFTSFFLTFHLLILFPAFFDWPVQSHLVPG